MNHREHIDEAERILDAAFQAHSRIDGEVVEAHQGTAIREGIANAVALAQAHATIAVAIAMLDMTAAAIDLALEARR